LLILDGHNVLFAMLPGGGHATGEALDAAQARLVEELGRHYRASGERATVVFDSRIFRGGARYAKSLPGIRLTYTHPPQTADDEVRRLVEASTAPQRLRVVSSDRAVMRACAERGATVVASEAFLREIRAEAQRLARDEAEQDIKTGRPSSEELRELLAAFGDVASGEPLRTRPRQPPAGRHAVRRRPP